MLTELKVATRTEEEADGANWAEQSSGATPTMAAKAIDTRNKIQLR